MNKIFKRRRGQTKKGASKKGTKVTKDQPHPLRSPDTQPIAVLENEEGQNTTVTMYAEVHQKNQDNAVTMVSTPPSSSEVKPMPKASTADSTEMSSKSDAISLPDDSSTKSLTGTCAPTVSSSSGVQLSDKVLHIPSSKEVITSDVSTCCPNSSSSSCYHSATDSGEDLDCGDDSFKGNVLLSFVEWLKDSRQIWGHVKVRNFPGEKRQVFVRWTSDNWSSYTDTQGITKASVDDKIQKRQSYTYTFEIPVRENADSVEFAVAYEVDGSFYWDNNSYKNYNIAVQD